MAAPVPTGNPLPSDLANTLDQLKLGCQGIRNDEKTIHGAILTLRTLGYLASAPVPAGQTVGVTCPQQYIPGPALIALYQAGNFPPGNSTYGWLTSPDMIVQAANACELLDFTLSLTSSSNSLAGQLANPVVVNDQPYVPLAAITKFAISSN